MTLTTALWLDTWDEDCEDDEYMGLAVAIDPDWADPIPWAGPCAAEVLGADIGELEDMRPWGCTPRLPLDVRYLGLPTWLLEGLAHQGDLAAREVLDDLRFERELAVEEAELARLGTEKLY